MIDLKNTIYNKDCIEIMRQIREKSIDLIVTDPPYLMNYKTGRRKDKNHKFCSTILNDDNFELISSYIKLAYNILKDNTAMYMFCNVLHFDFFKNELENTGFTIKNMIIWVKNNWTAGDLKNAYGRQYEIIFYVNKGKREINGKRLSDVWFFDRVAGKNQRHPNEKPLKLINRMVLNSSNEGDIVFDGFCGGGSVGESCFKNNRFYCLCEIDKHYYDVAKEKLNSLNNVVEEKNKLF